MNTLINFIFGAALFLMGLVATIFHKFLGKSAYEFQKKYFGYLQQVRFLQFMYLLGGLTFIVVGLLAIFGVIRFR